MNRGVYERPASRAVSETNRRCISVEPQPCRCCFEWFSLHQEARFHPSSLRFLLFLLTRLHSDPLQRGVIGDPSDRRDRQVDDRLDVVEIAEFGR